MARRRSRYASPRPAGRDRCCSTARRGAAGGGRGSAAGSPPWRSSRWSAAASTLWRSQVEAADARQEAAERFAAAWAGARSRGDVARADAARARDANPERRFAAAYRERRPRGGRARGPRSGGSGPERDGRVAVPVSIQHRLVRHPARHDRAAGVRHRRRRGRRLELLAAAAGAAARRGRRPARRPARRGAARCSPPTARRCMPARRSDGLEQMYADRLTGHPSGAAAVRRPRGRPHARRPRPPGADDDRAGARPRGRRGARRQARRHRRDPAARRRRAGARRPRGLGAAAAGLGVQDHHRRGGAGQADREAVDAYPVQTAATLSGVTLRNAGGEACGGTLANSFAHSCNSVFAPLGAKLGARRLVAAARAFGFGEQPRIPDAKPSTISPSAELRDDLAVGAAAIGQDRDLATPLAMASVGATIANGGRRARAADHHARASSAAARRLDARGARGARDDDRRRPLGHRHRRRRFPGVQVAGKTGTAELVPELERPEGRRRLVRRVRPRRAARASPSP